MNPESPVPLTVALLTYNRLPWLREAVTAILNQTYRDFEFLILDNHSTDGTAEFVIGLDDPRIRYVRNAPGFGQLFNAVSASRMTRGDRIIIANDDDVMEAEMLERQMDFMDQHPEMPLVFVEVTKIDAAGKPVECLSRPNQSMTNRVFMPGEFIADFLASHLWPMPSGMMHDRRFCDEANYDGLYFFKQQHDRMKIHGSSDALFPARVNLRHPIGFIPEPLLRYRVHSGQDTRLIDISNPLITLYKILLKLSRRIPGHPIPAINCKAQIFRFQVQDMLTMTEAHILPEIRSHIFRRWRSLSVEITTDVALFALLPVVLAIIYLERHKTRQKNISTDDALMARIAALPAAGNYPQAMYKFQQWVTRLTSGGHLLQKLKNKRLLVFGSATVAALAILDAKQNGCPVVACIDSNLNRQGRHMLAIPIHPPAWLAEHEQEIDTVLLTSEKAHETILTNIVRKFSKNVEIVSWKDLLK
jgi:glycosyltransferase involved in cell wall biosynthesis